MHRIEHAHKVEWPTNRFVPLGQAEQELEYITQRNDAFYTVASSFNNKKATDT